MNISLDLFDNDNDIFQMTFLCPFEHAQGDGIIEIIITDANGNRISLFTSHSEDVQLFSASLKEFIKIVRNPNR